MPDLHTELSPDLVARLACPVCGASLRVSDSGGGLACTAENPQGRTHCFDGAASGYLPLAPRHPGGGDSKEAVRARTAFLGSGYYAPLADAILAAVSTHTPAGGCILDAGCGEGYYSSRMVNAGFSVMGVDLSKFAVETAAKAARAVRLRENASASRTLYAVGSVFELPVREACFDTVTNIFAPCAPAEYARVLKPDGHLIVVGAGERHLLGLKEILYEDPYLNQPRRDLPTDSDAYTLLSTEHASTRISVEGREHIAALFSMTPYYWRTPRDSHERLWRLERLETEVSFDIHIYKKH